MLPRTHNPSSTAAAASARRLSPNAPQICAALTAILLLLSLAVLHSRLSSSPFPISFPLPFHSGNSKLQSYPSLSDDPFADADNDSFDGSPDDDRIDALDFSDDAPPNSSDDLDPESDDDPRLSPEENDSLFWDHSLAVFRRSFAKPITDLTDPDPNSDAEIAFSSDDEPLGDEIRSKLHVVSRIEDILMVKTAGVSDNPLRNGWASWLEGKGDFLRRDRMLKSNLELLNPKNHPLLQDPDVSGASGHTRGDNLVHKSILREMEKVAFPGVEKEGKIRRGLKLEEVEDSGRRRWGYFPGIDGGLSFSDFLETFFEAGKCGIRVFMVWNSPSWMFGVRHQRGLESLLNVHKDACVVVLSETMEMDFFQSFVNDGFRVAVAMPDLDELLKDTPTHEFASLWYEWRQTKHYPIHYSELIRLASLYKYGGVYVDSDVIVLKPFYSLKNTVALESQRDDGSSIYNGAIMAFEKDSPFLMECLGEFYSTYNDELLRWNGADLLTRVINRLNDKGDNSFGHVDIKIVPPVSFFPISAANITRYFAEAADEIEKAEEELLFAKILNKSTAFHFWNTLTSALVPEPTSLVERVLNHNCLRCHDIL